MRYILSIATLCIAIVFSACKKSFLELPLSNTTTVDSVFTTWQKAQGAVANAYRRNIPQGLPFTNWWNAQIQANISGELSYGHPWSPANDIIKNGFTANGPTEDQAGYGDNFPPIRQAYEVIENIDKVKDLSAADKAIIKAEMRALIAYRYEQMFIMYGGVPIVSKAYLPDDDLTLPRSSLQAVLDSIVGWCNQAVTVLPSKWPDQWNGMTSYGRMTKAAVLAIKSKAELYAARPLFNSATPYLSSANNSLVCFGNYNAARWTTAAATAEALIAEAEGAGGLQIINTGNPLDDYGTATSTPSNPEVVLAFKFINTAGGTDNWQELPMNAFYNPRWYWQAQASVLLTSHLENYYKADGSNQSWPGVGQTLAFSDYTSKMNAMEPRFKASFMPFQMDAWNNPNDATWANANVGNGPGYGCARSVKFYYKAGTRRWFEFPVFRLAAAYLSAAEAYNEMGRPQDALVKLNKIHTRAGLPAITTTDQAQLRTIIQREWAVEFFDENYRLHDIKHWKLANIENGIIGGGIRSFQYNSNTGVKTTGNSNYTDLVIYQGFWAPRMYLNPFPQYEVNKGTVVQNPGY